MLNETFAGKALMLAKSPDTEVKSNDLFALNSYPH